MKMLQEKNYQGDVMQNYGAQPQGIDLKVGNDGILVTNFPAPDQQTVNDMCLIAAGGVLVLAGVIVALSLGE